MLAYVDVFDAVSVWNIIEFSMPLHLCIMHINYKRLPVRNRTTLRLNAITPKDNFKENCILSSYTCTYIKVWYCWQLYSLDEVECVTLYTTPSIHNYYCRRCSCWIGIEQCTYVHISYNFNFMLAEWNIVSWQILSVNR